MLFTFSLRHAIFSDSFPMARTIIFLCLLLFATAFSVESWLDVGDGVDPATLQRGKRGKRAPAPCIVGSRWRIRRCKKGGKRALEKMKVKM